MCPDVLLGVFDAAGRGDNRLIAAPCGFWTELLFIDCDVPHVYLHDMLYFWFFIILTRLPAERWKSEQNTVLWILNRMNMEMSGVCGLTHQHPTYYHRTDLGAPCEIQKCGTLWRQSQKADPTWTSQRVWISHRDANRICLNANPREKPSARGRRPSELSSGGLGGCRNRSGSGLVCQRCSISAPARLVCMTFTNLDLKILQIFSYFKFCLSFGVLWRHLSDQIVLKSTQSETGGSNGTGFWSCSLVEELDPLSPLLPRSASTCSGADEEKKDERQHLGKYALFMLDGLLHL